MHAVVRTYTGPGAKELAERIAARSAEIEGLIRGVPGIVSYTFITTPEGGMSVTVCQDRAGTDESIRVAREWITKNAADLSTSPPAVAEGPAVVQLTS
jgi:hypothetical protein